MHGCQVNAIEHAEELSKQLEANHRMLKSIYPRHAIELLTNSKVQSLSPQKSYSLKKSVAWSQKSASIRRSTSQNAGSIVCGQNI